MCVCVYTHCELCEVMSCRDASTLLLLFLSIPQHIFEKNIFYSVLFFCCHCFILYFCIMYTFVYVNHTPLHVFIIENIYMTNDQFWFYTHTHTHIHKIVDQSSVKGLKTEKKEGKIFKEFIRFEKCPTRIRKEKERKNRRIDGRTIVESFCVWGRCNRV